MTDIVLNHVTHAQSVTTINENFDKIENAINNDVLHLAGGNNTMLQELDMNGNKITNMFTDVNDPDSFLTVGAADARYYNVAGDTLTGTMNTAGNKIVNLPAATSSGEPVRKAEFDAAVFDTAFALRNDLANNVDPTKGASLVGAILDGGEPTTVDKTLGAYINVLTTGMLNDATSEIQGYINDKSQPRLKKGVYRVTAPITLQQGARLSGGGWRVDNDNLSTLLNGNSSTIYVDHDGPVFVWDGDKDAGNFADNFKFEDFAIYSPTLGTSTAGFNLDAFRSSSFKNLYLYQLVTGIKGTGQSWQNIFERVWTNACTRGFDSNASIEDSTFISCVARFGDIGFRQNFSGQTNNIIGCDFSRNRLGFLLNSGGTFNGHVNLQGCQFEMANGADAAIRVESASSLLPSLTVSNCRFLGLESVPTAPCIFLNQGTNLVTIRNTARNVKDFISVAGGAVATSEVTRINDELSLVGGFAVAGDNGTFVTTISDNRITAPTGTNKGLRVGSDIFLRQQDGGSKEVVLGDATVGRATDGEVSFISASGKALRMKPNNVQTAVFSQTKSSISNQVGMTGLPTSTAGLVTGDLWRDAAAGNVIKMIP